MPLYGWAGCNCPSAPSVGCPRAAGDLRVLDELDGICPACVLCDVRVGVIDVMIFIEHHVLEHRAEAQRLEDVQLAGNAPAL